MGVCVFVTQQNIATAYAATAVTIMVSSNSADTILAGNLVLLSSAANRKHALNLGAHKQRNTGILSQSVHSFVQENCKKMEVSHVCLCDLFQLQNALMIPNTSL